MPVPPVVTPGRRSCDRSLPTWRRKVVPAVPTGPAASVAAPKSEPLAGPPAARAESPGTGAVPAHSSCRTRTRQRVDRGVPGDRNSCQRLQTALQFVQAAPQPDLDAADGRADVVGDLRMTEPMVIDKREALTLGSIDRIQAVADCKCLRSLLQ